MKIIKNIEDAWQLLQQGKVIAYPTEAVYGLGCDPFNEAAVESLLSLKKRNTHKGLIVLIAHWQQLTPLIAPISESQLAAVKASWPGPVTWIFPKSNAIPALVCGDHTTIAIRMSAHSIARQLCLHNPVVSTSANLSGHPPARHVSELALQFPIGLEGVVSGELGGASQPSAIYEVLTGQRLR